MSPQDVGQGQKSPVLACSTSRPHARWWSVAREHVHVFACWMQPLSMCRSTGMYPLRLLRVRRLSYACSYSMANHGEPRGRSIPDVHVVEAIHISCQDPAETSMLCHPSNAYSAYTLVKRTLLAACQATRCSAWNGHDQSACTRAVHVQLYSSLPAMIRPEEPTRSCLTLCPVGIPLTGKGT